MLKWYRRHRRERLLAQPFPGDWETFLMRNVGHYRLLDEDERSRLRNDTRILVAEKNWEGCGGLQITEEMKVTIAAQACLMLLGREHDYFGRVLSILVYPSRFRVKDRWEDEKERGSATWGQAVYRGPVILAWDLVLADGKDPSGGTNLVIHEFAHQLDFLDGYVNGTPDLPNGEQGERWFTVMTTEYDQHQRNLRQGRDTFLGDYAGRNEGEFFAVASELFFTLPERLRHYHPALYAVLAEYYGVEPIQWFARNERAS
jgi:Mlc titration factor MtfA (ptsG expression regulator)